MMDKRTGVSKEFIILLLLFIIGISGAFYMKEMKELENTISIPAKVVSARNIPRICILGLKTENNQLLRQLLTVTVPSWDSKKVGDSVMVRVDLQNPSNAEIDRLIYLHRTSIGIIAGTAFLFIILLVVKIKNKTF